MSTTHTYIGGQNYNETVTINESINLAKFEVGGVAPGQVTGENPGIIPVIPSGGSDHGLMISINNTEGSAPAFLAKQSEIVAYDAVNNSVVPWGAYVVPAGQADTFGPLDWVRYNVVLRQLVGAKCRVTVNYSGPGVKLT